MRRLYLFCFFLIITFGFVIKAQERVILEETIELPKQKYSLQEIFDKLETQNIITSYNSNDVKTKTSLIFSSKRITVAELLNILKKDYSINSKVKNNKIIFTKIVRSYTISGTIKEQGSGETLIGANILSNSGYGTTSNAYGFYSITLPEGEYQLKISYIGYLPKSFVVKVHENTKLDIELKSAFHQLSELIVSPQASIINNKEFSRINLEKVNNIPLFLGADDAIKRLQLIPGTGGGTTGFADLSVRGGNVHENLVLLDGVPVYNYNHFPGILSIFNTQALKNIDFYKGQFPARYAGRLSSVTDIKMREGNMQTYHIGGSIDLATLSMYVEGPIVKDKASFIVSGRRSWIDGLTSLGNKDEKFNFHLQDINIKTNYLATKRDRFYFSFYKGADRLGDVKNSDNSETLSWTNNIVALRWNHTFSDKIFGNTLLSFSKFDNSVATYSKRPTHQTETINRYSLSEFNLATDIEYYGEWYQFRFGTAFQKNSFEIPFKPQAKEEDEMNVFQWKSYVENKINITRNLYGNIGLNYILYHNKKVTDNFFQPRMNLSYLINSTSNLSISFSEMYQFIHQLGSYNINLPYAFRLPASAKFAPSVSRLYELRYNAQPLYIDDNLSVSLYYKKQKKILRYKPGQDLFNEQLADDWENQVLSGQRKTFGLEVAYSVNFNPLAINLSYTYAKNQEKFPSINNNKYYPKALSPAHILLFTTEYIFNKRHSISALAEYNTGSYMTLPVYKIESIDDAVNQTNTNKKSYVYGKINGFQLDDNYHIDLGYTFQTQSKKHGKHIIKAGLYSILGNPTPFRATAKIYEDKLNIEEVALPNLMPYLSYTFKF